MYHRGVWDLEIPKVENVWNIRGLFIRDRHCNNPLGYKEGKKLNNQLFIFLLAQLGI